MKSDYHILSILWELLDPVGIPDSVLLLLLIIIINVIIVTIIVIMINYYHYLHIYIYVIVLPAIQTIINTVEYLCHFDGSWCI